MVWDAGIDSEDGALATSSHPAALQHADNVIVEIIVRPTLSLTCPKCDAVFASAMQMDPKTFGVIRVTNMFECCPKCSTVSRFSKSDYLFRSED